ncbi:MAG: helix-turn-helix domain-containing protein, partial [Polyangiales bacterium]
MATKKANPSVQRRKRAAQGGRVRLREQFRSYARAVILEAGEDVMATQGLHTARMEEVAQKARVAVGTIYNLIGDRDALVGEILRLRHDQVVSLLQRSLDEVQGLDFRAQATQCLGALLQYFREHRRFFQMALESEHGPACANKRLSQETLGKVREVFQELVSRGVRGGVLRPDVLELGPTLLMGMMREVIMSDV